LVLLQFSIILISTEWPRTICNYLLVEVAQHVEDTKICSCVNCELSVSSLLERIVIEVISVDCFP